MGEITIEDPIPPRVLVGSTPSHWLFSPTPSYDLTRSKAPHFLPPAASSSITLQTTTQPITLSPSSTSLIIIGMQNYFLSPSSPMPFDKRPANLAKAVLLQTAIPAARKAGMRLTWVNWGLEAEEEDSMPAALVRVFGFQGKPAFVASPQIGSAPSSAARHEDVVPRTEGLGFPLGPVTLEDGSVIDGGILLRKGSWNAALPPDLNAMLESSKTLACGPDILVHQNRISAFWNGQIEVLKKAGIKTLLFAGTKTDMCVQANLLDAWHGGMDVVLLRDCCGTTSPESVSGAVEFNCARVWGFVSDSEALERGVEGLCAAGEGRRGVGMVCDLW